MGDTHHYELWEGHDDRHQPENRVFPSQILNVPEQIGFKRWMHKSSKEEIDKHNCKIGVFEHFANTSQNIRMGLNIRTQFKAPNGNCPNKKQNIINDNHGEIKDNRRSGSCLICWHCRGNRWIECHCHLRSETSTRKIKLSDGSDGSSVIWRCNSMCGAVLADAGRHWAVSSSVVSTDAGPDDPPDCCAQQSQYDEADGAPRSTATEQRSALAEHRVDHRVRQVECRVEEEEGERSWEEDQPEDRVCANRRELPPRRCSSLLCADHVCFWPRGDQQERGKANSAHHVAEGGQLHTIKISSITK